MHRPRETFRGCGDTGRVEKAGSALGPMRLVPLLAFLVVAAVTTLCLSHPQTERPDVQGVRAAAPGLGARPDRTEEAFVRRATPLLQRLTAGSPLRDIQVSPAIAQRIDGRVQRLYDVAALAQDRDGSEYLVGVRFDAGSGKLVMARTTRGMARPDAPGAKAFTAGEAVRAARHCLPALGLAPVGAAGASAVRVPYRSQAGLWRVWLRAQERPDGEALTVSVTVNAFTGDLRHAVVLERTAQPFVYLSGAAAASR